MKKSKGFDLSEFKICANCIHGKELTDSELFVCKKHGLKNSYDVCKKFEFDLLAVKPKKLRTFTQTFSEEDFTL